MKKPKISAEVSQEEFDAYKVEATSHGLSLSEWIRLALNSSIPAAKAKAPDVADAVFKQLDQQDAVGGVMTEVVKPTAEVLKPPLQTLPPAPVTDHPCVYLDPARPGVLSSGECSGTCQANSQRGKPCFFGPMNARRCPIFVSRMVPSAPVLDIRARK